MHNRTPNLHGKPNNGKTTMTISSNYKIIATLNTIGSLLEGSFPKTKKPSLSMAHCQIIEK
jgi:hypothetical protein